MRLLQQSRSPLPLQTKTSTEWSALRTKPANNLIPRKKKTKTQEARCRIDVPFLARSARACVARLAAARSDSFHEKVESRTITCSLTSERRASRAWPVGGAEICRSSSKSSSNFLFWPFFSGKQWSGRLWRSMDKRRRRRRRRRRRSLCLSVSRRRNPKCWETRSAREEEEAEEGKKRVLQMEFRIWTREWVPDRRGNSEIASIPFCLFLFTVHLCPQPFILMFYK